MSPTCKRTSQTTMRCGHPPSSLAHCARLRLFAGLQELAQLADDMSLQVPDLDALIDSLNEAGYLLKKAGAYQVRVKYAVEASG